MQKESVVLELTLPKAISLNQLYAGKHWTYRKKQKDEYTKLIKAELDNYDHYTAQSMSIDIKYNCRYDVDNSIVCAKFVADALVHYGWIPEDNTKHYQSLRIRYDESIEKNICKVRIALM